VPSEGPEYVINSSNSKTNKHHAVHPSGSIFPEGESNGIALVPFSGAFAKLRKATISFVIPAREEQLGFRWTEFHEILYLSIFRKPAQKIQVLLKSDRNNGYFNEDQYTFLIITRLIILRMINVSDKSCTENQNTHLRFCRLFLNIVQLMRQYGKMLKSRTGHR
jgi:hypothetical protein